MTVIACGLGFWLSACVDSSAPVPPVTPLTDLHSRLILTPDAVVMVVGERIPVTVTALNLLGEPFSIEGGAPVVWTSSDTASVEIDANGMLYAKQVPSLGGVTVQGMWKHNGIERGGIVFVTVTPTKYPIAKLKIVPKDSARTSWSDVSFFDGFAGFSVVATKDNGDTIATLPFFVTANRRSIMAFYYGDFAMLFVGAPYMISSRVVGPYWLHTHASVYGTTLRDSVQYMGLYAYNAQIPITRDSATNTAVSPYANEDVIVQPCGEIQFNNRTSTPIDIVFDDPQKATGCVSGNPTGNIEGIEAQGTVGRKFRAAGTVQWTVRDRVTGQLQPSARGTITMKEP